MNSEILSVADARKLRDRLDAAGRKLVFSNGCFDILHRGHVEYLEFARAQGDAFIVGLNSDSSVQRIKGPGRPINSEAIARRSCRLCALSMESSSLARTSRGC